MMRFAQMIAGLLLLGPSARAAETATITLDDVKFVIPMTKTMPTAIFLNLQNTGAVDDDWVSVSSPLCERAEIHDHIDDNGILKMRQVDKVVVPAGGTVKLVPMGKHIMCFGPSKAAKSGEMFDLTLTFIKSGAITIKTGHVVTMSDFDHHGHHP